MISTYKKKRGNTYYFDSKFSDSILEFAKTFRLMLEEYWNGFDPLILICIGSDRSTGDSLGPMIGYKLKKNKCPGIDIYGTLQNPVHALNLESTLTYIEDSYENPFIIAVDASLGSKEHVGFATIGPGPLKPGQGVQKKLPNVGNLCITGIVNCQGVLDSLLLQSTRLSTVMALADCISLGILLCQKDEGFAYRSHSSLLYHTK